jgi:hypothetical protein
MGRRPGIVRKPFKQPLTPTYQKTTSTPNINPKSKDSNTPIIARLTYLFLQNNSCYIPKNFPSMPHTTLGWTAALLASLVFRQAQAGCNIFHSNGINLGTATFSDGSSLNVAWSAKASPCDFSILSSGSDSQCGAVFTQLECDDQFGDNNLQVGVTSLL